MPVVRFSNEDFLAGKVVKPSLYHVLIKSITTQPAKTDGSAVHKVSVKIVQPGDFFGVPLQDYISEKAEGTAIPFVKACNGGVAPNADQNYELNNGVGMVIRAQVQNGLFQGKVKNEIVDYQPAEPGFKLED